METRAVIEAIIEVLSQQQKRCGRPLTVITEQTCPITDLEEFDSLTGVEATVELAERLKVDIPGVNVFVDKEGTTALTVAQTAASICDAVNGKD